MSQIYKIERCVGNPELKGAMYTKSQLQTLWNQGTLCYIDRISELEDDTYDSFIDPVTEYTGKSLVDILEPAAKSDNQPINTDVTVVGVLNRKLIGVRKSNLRKNTNYPVLRLISVIALALGFVPLLVALLCMSSASLLLPVSILISLQLWILSGMLTLLTDSADLQFRIASAVENVIVE